jgi:hypothetical protein
MDEMFVDCGYPLLDLTLYLPDCFTTENTKQCTMFNLTTLQDLNVVSKNIFATWENDEECYPVTINTKKGTVQLNFFVNSYNISNVHSALDKDTYNTSDAVELLVEEIDVVEYGYDFWAEKAGIMNENYIGDIGWYQYEI